MLKVQNESFVVVAYKVSLAFDGKVFNPG